MSVAEALREAAARLDGISDTARLDAELLMAHALGVTRSDLLVRCMTDPAPAKFADMIGRRLTQEPVAYILGEQEFHGLTFAVSPAVLIPRADSEVLVDRAIAAQPEARRVLDCGTGSGALLLAVLMNLPRATGTGIDSSLAALAIASTNAEQLGLADRAVMLAADWNEPGWTARLDTPFDLVLANPPYVEDGAVLDRSVRGFEPAKALFAGPDGLEAYRVLVPQLPALLSENGAALVEIGFSQAASVGQIAEKTGLSCSLYRDLGGRPRVLEMRRQAKFMLGKPAGSH